MKELEREDNMIHTEESNELTLQEIFEGIQKICSAINSFGVKTAAFISKANDALTPFFIGLGEFILKYSEEINRLAEMDINTIGEIYPPQIQNLLSENSDIAQNKK